MLNHYKILTVTHRHTKLNELGKYVVQNAEGPDLAQRLSELKENFGMQELLYLATCNRVMYLFVSDDSIDEQFAISFFQSVNPLLTEEELADIAQIAAIYEGEDALQHVYEVAASVDSLVVGEREILRQLREAYEQCHSWGLTNDNLRLAIQNAIQAAKKVYAKTRIGEKPISVVSLAIQKLHQSKLSKDSRILLIGAGQTNELVAKFLQKYQYKNVVVFNRSLEKARHLAQMFGTVAFELNALANYRDGFDIMIVCTGATKAIIDQSLYKSLLGGDNGLKLIIDLAIPNNVAKVVVHQNRINYIEIEGLRNLAKENLAFREREVFIVKSLLSKELNVFPSLFQQRQIEHAMKAIPAEIKAIKTHAMDSVFRKEIEALDPQTKALVENILTYMEKRCIGIPMKAAIDAVR